MAVKKKASQAQKAVSDAKKNEKSTKKSSAASSNANVKNKDFENSIPKNYMIAFISIALFIVFLVAAINPDGWLLVLIESIVKGLIGAVGFYFSIPALLYIFFIQIFGKKSKTTMRTLCVIAFVLICGCIAHMSIDSGFYSMTAKLIGQFYKGGASGTTGGVICGLIAMYIRQGCGTLISYILFSLCAALTLLGSMQITIPSLIKAIRNRPRDEFDDLDEEEVDPATVVVNRIANKQIARARQKREQTGLSQQVRFIDETQSAASDKKTPRKKPPKTGDPRVDDFMNQLDAEIGAPVAAAAEYVSDKAALAEIPDLHPQKKQEEVPVSEEIPQSMPELILDEPVADTQKKTAPTKRKEKSSRRVKVTSKDTSDSAQQVAQEIADAQAEQAPAYCFPPIDLLERPSRGGSDGTEEMRVNSRRLNETLASFKIDAHIINVTRGPSVTRYEVELDKGVRLNKLTSCADDIALSLGASGVRIAAVPDKISIVGIEVPNRTVTNVNLREVIDSSEFHKSKSKSSFAVGKDIGGNCIVGNIRKMPHMLIAGTTGSGKSVCLNCMIVSILYNATPSQVKLLMIDPKQVEFSVYNGIPHLLVPVISNVRKAAGALAWAVTEMENRYKTFSECTVHIRIQQILSVASRA